MKNLLAALLVVFLASAGAFAQSTPVGLYKTIDDNSGKARSHIEIYEQGGKYYGKIVKLLLKPQDTKCIYCEGEKKDKPLVGMTILEGLEPYDDYWSNGKIMDPETGKVYKCSIWQEDGKLKVRGYIGISALGRTQEWLPVD